MSKTVIASRNLVSVEQAARIAGCSTRTVRRWISAGDLTGYRVGKRLIRVDVADLDRLVRPIVTAVGGGGFA